MRLKDLIEFFFLILMPGVLLKILGLIFLSHWLVANGLKHGYLILLAGIFFWLGNRATFWIYNHQVIEDDEDINK